MRCSDCNRFVSLELGEPDLNIDIDEEGTVGGEVTINRNCVECGTECKEGRFDIAVTIPEVAAHLQEHKDEQAAKDKERAEAEKVGEATDESDDGFDPELTIEDEEVEATEGGTGRKPTFGFRASFNIVCSCGKFEHTGEASDEMVGSEMEELS